MNKKEPVVAEDVAEEEFERFIECMDIDFDLSVLEDEAAGMQKTVKKRIVNAIMCGSMIINDDGEPVFTPQRPRSKHKEPITFRERTGANVMSQDTKKRGHDIARMYAFLASVSGESVGTFAGLAGADLNVCEAVFVLLMV